MEYHSVRVDLSWPTTINPARGDSIFSGQTLTLNDIEHDFIWSGGNSRDRAAAISSGFSDRHHRAVELPEGKAIEVFVVLPFLVAENTDGDGLAQSQRFDPIRTPVYTSDVASGCNIGSQFV